MIRYKPRFCGLTVLISKSFLARRKAHSRDLVDEALQTRLANQNTPARTHQDNVRELSHRVN